MRQLFIYSFVAYLVLTGCSTTETSDGVTEQFLVGVWSLEGPPPCGHGNTIRFAAGGEVALRENMTGLWVLDNGHVEMILREYEVGRKDPVSVFSSILRVTPMGPSSFEGRFDGDYATVVAHRCDDRVTK